MDTESLGICAYLYVGQEQNNGSSKRYGLIWSALCVVFFIHQFYCTLFIVFKGLFNLGDREPNQTTNFPQNDDTVIPIVALVFGAHACKIFFPTEILVLVWNFPT